MSKEQTEFERYRDEYFDWLAYTHYSERTISVRQRLLKYFFAWCDDRGLDRVNDISRSVMESYQRHLFKYRKANGEPLVISSQIRRLGTVSGFFKYLASKHYVIYNPVAELQMPRKDVRLPSQVLNPDEVEQIMIQPDLNQPEGIRDRAILEVFYSTGMRRMEMAGLSIYDIDFTRGIIFIKNGKGRKDRYVPVGERAMKWITKYLEEVRDKFLFSRDELALFLGVHGTGLGEVYLTELCGSYIKKADIGKRGSCHIFRHTAATLMLENGADIRFIQQLLGHADIKTTQIYTKVSIKQLKNVHDLTHPSSQTNSPLGANKEDLSEPQKSEDSS